MPSPSGSSTAENMGGRKSFDFDLARVLIAKSAFGATIYGISRERFGERRKRRGFVNKDETRQKRYQLGRYRLIKNILDQRRRWRIDRGRTRIARRRLDSYNVHNSVRYVRLRNVFEGRGGGRVARYEGSLRGF